MWGDHEDCALCQGCGRHLDETEQWPCLECGQMLCEQCECVVVHVVEVCS